MPSDDRAAELSVPLPNRRPTKHDVDLFKLARNGQLWEQGIKWAGIVLTVLMSSVPMLVVARAVDSVAGKDTTVDVKVAVSLSVALTGIAAIEGWTIRYLRRQVKERDKEIARLKARLDGTDTR